MSTDEKKLRDVLQHIYNQRSSAISISPSWLATEAMQELDPRGTAPSLVYRGCHLQLRQISRAICRQRFEDNTGETEQHELFPNLQKRYPKAHAQGAEPEYVLLESMTEQDVAFNVNRLRREANAKLYHADALEAWGHSREAA